jgi:hypothetical protein
MTRIVFLSALTALVGCKKDECDDTAAGACDTGVEEEAEEEVPGVDSCTIGVISVCVEATEPDNEAWCTGLDASYDASYSADPCSTDGLTGTCALPAGGDYSAPATGYYTGSDAAADEAACDAAGGTWSAA